VGHDGTEAWLQAIGTAAAWRSDKIDAAKDRFLPAIKPPRWQKPDQGAASR
jgi:chlorophyllide a reductase subunit Y